MGRIGRELIKQISFDEPTRLRRLNRSIPTDLETIVQRAMAKDPRDRYPTALELSDDLRRFLDDKPIKARPPSLTNRALKWSRRHRTFVAAAAVILVVTTISLAVATVPNHPGDKQEKRCAGGRKRVQKPGGGKTCTTRLLGKPVPYVFPARTDTALVSFDLIKQARALKTNNLDVDRLRDEAVRFDG